ncbi:dephospho-CoA kinase [Thermosipho atlanticus]|uniref:Dephospho-CoA kinase n=1 Tax=Thermosipho atlanticus DSM 15807 TaxID=1123380 RepID=A0A1M5SLY7_9BACT|nr:dephospho-CoA kinase [Thermosipho atlanticus]SHH39450.1 dephospho-CoA kinase [Thermosipho atlanticus DSM 15807]
MRFILCITGKIGTGKTTVAHFFKNKGFSYINMDEIGHEAFDKKKHEIRDIFGTIDRKEISKIVFTNTEKLRVLESILHPEMKKILSEKLTRNLNYVIEAAIKRRLGIYCDFTITVTAEKKVIFNRLKNRGLSNIEIENILNSQFDVIPEGIVIDNSFSLEFLNKKLNFIYSFLKKSFEI